MPWTDSHGRPELVMHPDIKRGATAYRTEAPDRTADTARPSPQACPRPAKPTGRRSAARPQVPGVDAPTADVPTADQS